MNTEQETVTIKITVNGKRYTIACGDGEKEELKEAASILDQSIGEARQNQSSVLSDERLIMVTALNIVHQLHKEKQRWREKEKVMAQRINSANKQLEEKITPGADTTESCKEFWNNSATRIDHEKL